MVKFRLLLVLMAVVAVTIMISWYNIFFSSETQVDLWSVALGLIGIPAPFMFLSSLIMLAFSFLKVEEQDGMLVYDPRNPYWRVMSRLYKWKSSISLCKAFWLTAWTIFLVSMMSGSVMMIIFLGRSVDISMMLTTALKIVGGGATFLGVFALFVKFMFWLDEKHKAGNKFAGYVHKTIAVLLFTGMAGALLFLVISKQGGLMFLFLLPAIVLMLVIEWIKSLPKDNMLMRIFYSLKNNLCPILTPKKNIT